MEGRPWSAPAGCREAAAPRWWQGCSRDGPAWWADCRPTGREEEGTTDGQTAWAGRGQDAPILPVWAPNGRLLKRGSVWSCGEQPASQERPPQLPCLRLQGPWFSGEAHYGFSARRLWWHAARVSPGRPLSSAPLTPAVCPACCRGPAVLGNLPSVALGSRSAPPGRRGGRAVG